jgi:hypothetical protein
VHEGMLFISRELVASSVLPVYRIHAGASFKFIFLISRQAKRLGLCFLLGQAVRCGPYASGKQPGNGRVDLGVLDLGFHTKVARRRQGMVRCSLQHVNPVLAKYICGWIIGAKWSHTESACIPAAACPCSHATTHLVSEKTANNSWWTQSCCTNKWLH